MPSVLQKALIGEELLNSARLLKVGLRELNRMDASADFFHLPLLLLSSGFERMMKAAICCQYLDKHGTFPEGTKFFTGGKRGHDLVILLDRITRECYSDDYLSRVPAAQVDVGFLRDDERLKRVVQILSDFGKAARYYNLDVVLGEEQAGRSPEAEWQRLKLDVFQEDPDWAGKISDLKLYSTVQKQLNRELTIHFERWARSLSRLFTIGGLGKQAKQISPHVHHFVGLRDSDLGETDYSAISI